jgi:protein-S-isoprenylcysteine O-methyltransferase Ste14
VRSLKPITATLLGFLIVGGFVAGLFLVAGRWNWIQGWLFLAVVMAGETSRTVYIWITNPDLLRRRGRIGPGTKTWDQVLLGLFAFTYVLVPVVAALDQRYGWSAMRPWFWSLGVVLYVMNVVLVTMAMAENPFFEKTVRIQRELSHRVVYSGPYRMVRHPGYAATIIGFVLSTPLLLGSWWAFLPAGATSLVLILRTSFEDRTLRQELKGYEAYAARVCYRLVPGIW